MTKFPLPPCPAPGWPGLIVGVDEPELGEGEAPFFWPGLFLPGKGVMEIDRPL